MPHRLEIEDDREMERRPGHDGGGVGGQLDVDEILRGHRLGRRGPPEDAGEADREQAEQTRPHPIVEGAPQGRLH